VSDRELALRLGSLMLCTISSDGGSVIRAIDDSGLSFTQMKALVALAGHDEAAPVTVKRIAADLGLSLASASRAVDGLVKRELATRVEDPEDRRMRRISLTAEGQGVADELLAARLAGLERFVAGLGAEERRKLDAALEVLMRRPEIAKTYRIHKRKARS